MGGGSFIHIIPAPLLTSVCDRHQFLLLLIDICW